MFHYDHILDYVYLQSYLMLHIACCTIFNNRDAIVLDHCVQSMILFTLYSSAEHIMLDGMSMLERDVFYIWLDLVHLQTSYPVSRTTFSHLVIDGITRGGGVRGVVSMNLFEPIYIYIC